MKRAAEDAMDEEGPAVIQPWQIEQFHRDLSDRFVQLDALVCPNPRSSPGAVLGVVARLAV